MLEKDLRIAIVHDWLPLMGGAENVINNMLDVFPNATVYTTICNKDKLSGNITKAKIVTSHLQKGKKCIKNHRKLFPWMPMAIEHFDLTGYDIVISSSTSVAKACITGPDTLHICYCNTPMRYAWEFMHEYIWPFDGRKGLVQKWKAYFMSFMRAWDFVSSARPDVFIGNSVNVAKRIKKHYRRDNIHVLYPAVRGKDFYISETDGDYYLCVSRLQEYKRVDIAVEACTKLGKKLMVIGDGPQMERLKEMAGPTIEFRGRLPFEDIQKAYSECKAFLFPGEEDFGITPLEAQASGRPVIAYGKGGALETVVENETGLFFDVQNADSLMKAIEQIETMHFDKQKLRDHAMKFDEEVFKAKLAKFVDEQWKEYQEKKTEGISVL